MWNKCGNVDVVRMSHGVNEESKMTNYSKTYFFRFSHLFLIFNASVNFLIYCSLNNAFKIELKNVLNKILSQMV